MPDNDVFLMIFFFRFLSDIEKICRECEILNPPAHIHNILPGEVCQSILVFVVVVVVVVVILVLVFAGVILVVFPQQ